MKALLNTIKQVEVKKLVVSVGVRYWEDAEINGVEDENGDLIPCKKDNRWCPIIDIDTGKILNWEKGKTADIHYKVCDDGEYSILGPNDELIKKIDGYVPDMLAVDDNGYGYYIIMKVSKEGFIENWNPDLNYFVDD